MSVVIKPADSCGALFGNDDEESEERDSFS
jgi:hypothetical protein